jgi:hypothetical protein
VVAAAEGFSMAALVDSLADLVAEVADSVMDLDAIFECLSIGLAVELRQ